MLRMMYMFYFCFAVAYHSWVHRDIQLPPLTHRCTVSTWSIISHGGLTSSAIRGLSRLRRGCILTRIGKHVTSSQPFYATPISCFFKLRPPQQLSRHSFSPYHSFGITWDFNPFSLPSAKSPRVWGWGLGFRPYKGDRVGATGPSHPILPMLHTIVGNLLLECR